MRLVNWFIADRLDMLVRPNFRKHELLKWGIFFILLAILGFLYVASANAQVTVALSPTAKQQFFSATGIPLASGCVNTYITGTATPLATYVDGTGATQNANPIILDSGGFANIWLQNASYRFVVVAYDGIPGNKCAAGITQYTVDNINAYAPISTGANLFLLGQASDPAGTGGEMIYRNDIPCFRFFTTFWDCVVRLTDTQTLTNKTLASPTVTGTMTGPTTLIDGNANPSATGWLRLANQDFIKTRNAVNSGDLSLIGEDSLGFIDVGDSAGTVQILGSPLYVAGNVNITSNGPLSAGNGFSITMTATNGTGLGVHTGGNINFAAGLPVNGGAPGAVQVTVGALKLGVNNIAFTTTPSLDLSKGNVQQFNCTTPTSVINPSTANFLPGESFTFIFIQNGATACTLNYPSTMHGGTTVSSTLSSINVQEFVVSNNGTDAYAKAAASSTTGGAP